MRRGNVIFTHECPHSLILAGHFYFHLAFSFGALRATGLCKSDFGMTGDIPLASHIGGNEFLQGEGAFPVVP
jgi:hypothetical protein